VVSDRVVDEEERCVDVEREEELDRGDGE